MTTPSQVFAWPVRVYVEDTDFGGVVFYANYLKYMERARSEWLRAIGVTQQAMVDVHQSVFVVTSVSVDYLAPARMDDALTVTAAIEKLGRASMEFWQEVRRGDTVLVRGRVSIACVDSRTMRPRPIPEPIRAGLKVS